MPGANCGPLYRHTGVALLRSAVSPLTAVHGQWPDPSDTHACRSWLDVTWSRTEFADAIRQASPTLAQRVDAIRAGRSVEEKQLRRATVATARYLLRATGRPTPFGLFAGVAPVAFGRTAQVLWGNAHRPVVRADTQWLAAVIERLEACPELLDRLDVAFTNLAVRRGSRLEVPRGQNRVRVRYTPAVRAAQEAAASPVRFGVLVDLLTDAFSGADRAAVREMVTELVRQGFLITGLRAPLTITDPLGHLIQRLDMAGARALPSVAPGLNDLEAVLAEIDRHNDGGPPAIREALTRRMRAMSNAGRTTLALDLVLDCEVRLPTHVVHEIARAASALLRLTRRPAGSADWRAYHAAFRDRYGTGTLVPVSVVVDADAGLGFPGGYPGSLLPAAPDLPTERDQRLLSLAWQATVDGGGEVVLTDETIAALAGAERLGDQSIPPHVELAARVHASSVEALDRGDYTLTVMPARAGGVLTSRFTPTMTGSGLEDVYRSLPGVTEGALPVQLSFPPVYPHAENVCRVPAYLPHVLPLAEHRCADAGEVVPLSDLAITATEDRLHVVSVSRRRIVEAQVLHALALDKQAPPLARFLADLPRAFSAGWTAFDWGRHAERLPYLPRVRYRRSILAPARWRLTAEDLTREGDQRRSLDAWRQRWRCPCTVELRDDDRTLRLTLDQPIHAAILHAHLARRGHAILTDAPTELGWFAGRAHEIVLPLVATRPAMPSPLAWPLPIVTNRGHGQLPGEAAATWLYAKIDAHPERHDELIADQLPALWEALGAEVAHWFVRYRSPQETDHLRLRLRIPRPGRYGEYAAAVGDWARRLRSDGLIRSLLLDTYRPEIGRYGPGAAMEAAEAVFVADSRVVGEGLRRLPATVVHPTALAVAGMADIARGFLGCAPGMAWLADRPAPAGTVVDRSVADHAVRMAQPDATPDMPWAEGIAAAWRARTAALAAYRERLADAADTDAVLESLLHMHHNRALGIDPAGERTCRRLARQAALTWAARGTASIL